jgi:hypothetical protein
MVTTSMELNFRTTSLAASSAALRPLSAEKPTLTSTVSPGFAAARPLPAAVATDAPAILRTFRLETDLLFYTIKYENNCVRT